MPGMGGCETLPNLTPKYFGTMKVIGWGTYGTVPKVMFEGGERFYSMKAYRRDVLSRENMVRDTNEEKKNI